MTIFFFYYFILFFRHNITILSKTKIHNKEFEKTKSQIPSRLRLIQIKTKQGLIYLDPNPTLFPIPKKKKKTTTIVAKRTK